MAVRCDTCNSILVNKQLGGMSITHCTKCDNDIKDSDTCLYCNCSGLDSKEMCECIYTTVPCDTPVVDQFKCGNCKNDMSNFVLISGEKYKTILKCDHCDSL